MVTPTILAIAKADLITANRNVDSSNKFIKHQAAYFTQQSIEKTLKYLISLHSPTDSQPWGHDIKKLVMQATTYGIYIPNEIVINADLYSSWETVSRYYPTKMIRRDTIKKAIKVTHTWHRMLSSQGIK